MSIDKKDRRRESRPLSPEARSNLASAMEQAEALKKARRATFIAAVDGILENDWWSRNDICRLFHLKNDPDKLTSSEISRFNEKLRQPKPGLKNSPRAPSAAEILAVQLLVFLDSEGYDIRAFEFDELGGLKSVPGTPARKR